MCKLTYYFLIHVMQQPILSTPNMTNPVNESAYMELRSEYLSTMSPTAVVNPLDEVSVVMMLFTLTT